MNILIFIFDTLVAYERALYSIFKTHIICKTGFIITSVEICMVGHNVNALFMQGISNDDVFIPIH